MENTETRYYVAKPGKVVQVWHCTGNALGEQWEYADARGRRVVGTRSNTKTHALAYATGYPSKPEMIAANGGGIWERIK